MLPLWLAIFLEGRLQRAANDAGVCGFRVANGAGFVDVLAGEADVGGGGNVPGRNVGKLIAAFPAVIRNLTPLLSRIIFVSQAPLGPGLDFQSVGLRACILARAGYPYRKPPTDPILGE